MKEQQEGRDKLQYWMRYGRRSRDGGTAQDLQTDKRVARRDQGCFGQRDRPEVVKEKSAVAKDR